jgi:hypothetical protein
MSTVLLTFIGALLAAPAVHEGPPTAFTIARKTARRTKGFYYLPDEYLVNLVNPV